MHGARPDAERRETKFRQAAFVYLHITVLYEAAAWVMWRHGMLPTRFGPAWIWLLVGLGVGLSVFFLLLLVRRPWVPRAVWLVHGLRLPALIDGAYFAGEAGRVVPAFYITALVAVVVNLWMLARAGWDL